MVTNFRNCRGASALEFAVISTVFVCMLFGIMDFGWFFLHRLVVADAAREGARMAILNCDDPFQVTPGDVTNAINQKLAALGRVNTAPNPINPSSMPCGQAVTVTVTVPFQFLVLPNVITGLMNINNVSSTVVMIHEP